MARTNEGEVLRHAMRRVPSPVTVVCARKGSVVQGITIGSFTSVSLNPPLISFNVSHGAGMHDLLVEADRYCVQILGESQAEISDRFAYADLHGDEPFASLNTREGRFGFPEIDGVLAVFYCRHQQQVGAGDHTLFVGYVDHVDRRSEAPPLIYYDRAYRRLMR